MADSASLQARSFGKLAVPVPGTPVRLSADLALRVRRRLARDVDRLDTLQRDQYILPRRHEERGDRSDLSRGKNQRIEFSEELQGRRARNIVVALCQHRLTDGAVEAARGLETDAQTDQSRQSRLTWRRGRLWRRRFL